MKNKLLLGMALVLAFPLAGCNSALKKYTFKEELTSAEKFALIAKVTSSIDKIVSYSGSFNDKRTTDLLVYEQKITTKAEVFSNGVKVETTQKTTNTRADVTIKEEITNTSSYLFDEASKMAIDYEDNSKEGVSYYTYKYDEGKEAEQFQVNLHDRLTYEMYQTLANGNLKAYKANKNGYALLVSNETENHTYATNLGKYVEKIQRTESQEIVQINKNFEVTEYKRTYKELNNQDPDTKEYMKSLKVTRVTEISTKYKYGSRKSNNFSSIIGGFNSGYIDGLFVSLRTSNFVLDEDKWVFSSVSSATKNAEELKYSAPGKAHYKGTYTLKGNSERIGLNIEIYGDAIANLSVKPEEIKNIDFYVSEELAGTTKVADVTENNHYMLPEQYYYQAIAIVEFDVSYATNEKNASVENLKATFISPMLA